MKGANAGQCSPSPSLHAAGAAVQPRLSVLHLSTQLLVRSKMHDWILKAVKNDNQIHPDAVWVQKKLCRLLRQTAEQMCVYISPASIKTCAALFVVTSPIPVKRQVMNTSLKWWHTLAATLTRIISFPQPVVRKTV